MHGSSSPRLLYALITYNIATDAAVNTSYGLEAHIIEDLHFVMLNTLCIIAVAYSGILFFGKGGGGSTNPVEDRGRRERGSGGGSALVRGSGGSCNLVQEI